MIHTKNKQEGQGRTMQAEREELQQATRSFIRSLVRTGGSMVLLPVTRLPRESQHHFLAAGREFTRGWATLIHEFADGLQELAEDASARTQLGEDAHLSREAKESQDT